MIESSASPKLKPSPFARNHLIRDAVSQAIYEQMQVDPSIYLFGEGAWVKQFYDAPQIHKDFPQRVITMPICEDGMTNFAVGASLLGMKPVVNVISADFLYRAMDSIVNTAAKVNFTGGEHTIVIQAEFLLGGPTSGQRPEALFAHIPGLRVVIPSTPHDAYGLMKTALATPGVTLFFEDRMIQDNEEWKPEDLELVGQVPFGSCYWRAEGKDRIVTILTYGFMRQVVERALKSNDLSNGCCDVVDLRSLYPIDWGMLKGLLLRTRRVLLVEPDVQYGGIGAEIIAQIAEDMPDVRVKRLGARRATAPAATSLHSQMLPTQEEIIDAVKSLIG